MKVAHVTSRPDHHVGDRVIGLCGKEFKVKVLWADLPDDKPVCRTCINTLLTAATEADALIQRMRSRIGILSSTASTIKRLLDQERSPLELDIIAERDKLHQDRQRAEAHAAVTCTCTWTDADTREANLTCPIHAGSVLSDDGPMV